MTCARCAQPLSQSAAFCPRCGASIRQGGTPYGQDDRYPIVKPPYMSEEAYRGLTPERWSQFCEYRRARRLREYGETPEDRFVGHADYLAMKTAGLIDRDARQRYKEHQNARGCDLTPSQWLRYHWLELVVVAVMMWTAFGLVLYNIIHASP